MAAKAKRFGLRVAGAVSDAPCAIPGWPGFYRGFTPTPVGGEGDALTLEEAKSRLKAEQARIDEKAKEWERHEAEQVEADKRPHGPIPFGDVVEGPDGEPIIVLPTPSLELVEVKDVDAAEAAVEEARQAVVSGVAAHRQESLNKQEKEQLEADVEAAKEDA